MLGCTQPPKSGKQMYCVKHYWRWVRKGTTELDHVVYDLETGNCLQCGIDLTDALLWDDCDATPWSRFFCEYRCYKRYYRKRSENATQCVVCGSDIPASAPSTKKYCSPECTTAARRPSNYEGTDVVTGKAWHHMVQFYGGRCVNPNCVPKSGKFGRVSKDHVLPLSEGGSHTIDNLQPLCLQCNIVKGINHVDYRWDKGAAFMKYWEAY